MSESELPVLSNNRESLASKLGGRLMTLPPELQNTEMGIKEVVRLKIPEKNQKIYYKAIYKQDPNLILNYASGLLRTGKTETGNTASGTANVKETSTIVNDLAIKDLVTKLATRPTQETYNNIVEELEKKEYPVLAAEAKIAFQGIKAKAEELRKRAEGKNLIFPKKIGQLECDDPFFTLACLSYHKETFHGIIGHSPWISISDNIPLDYLYRGKEEAVLAVMTIPDEVPVINLSETMKKLNSDQLGIPTETNDLLLPVELNRNYLLGLIPLDLSKHTKESNNELGKNVQKVVSAYFKTA